MTTGAERSGATGVLLGGVGGRRPLTVKERMTLAVAAVLPREPVVVRLSRPSLIVSLESVAIEAARFVVDRTSILVAPKRTSVTLRSRRPARTAILGFEPEFVVSVARSYKSLGLDAAKLEGWLTRLELLPRTVWVHEIVHRYVFERTVLDQHANLTTKFLEIEILKEVGFLFRDRDSEGADRASTEQRYSAPIERALAFIEAHLFEPCGVKELARRSGASESTLLRSFRRELGSRPGEYWRTRRLDESLVLLRSGRSSVAEVATRAGYENPTSFAYAFRRRFGKPPSDFLTARPTKRAP